MPWKSQAQAAYMHIHHPEIAGEMDAKHRQAYPSGTHLPKHVAGSKRKRLRRKHEVGKSYDLIDIAKRYGDALDRPPRGRFNPQSPLSGLGGRPLAPAPSSAPAVPPLSRIAETAPSRAPLAIGGGANRLAIGPGPNRPAEAAAARPAPTPSTARAAADTPARTATGAPPPAAPTTPAPPQPSPTSGRGEPRSAGRGIPENPPRAKLGPASNISDKVKGISPEDIGAKKAAEDARLAGIRDAWTKQKQGAEALTAARRKLVYRGAGAAAGVGAAGVGALGVSRAIARRKAMQRAAVRSRNLKLGVAGGAAGLLGLGALGAARRD